MSLKYRLLSAFVEIGHRSVEGEERKYVPEKNPEILGITA